MTARTILTRRPFLRRALDELRAIYLRVLIGAAERDAMRHDWHAHCEPRLAAIGTGPDAERAARRSVETMTVGGHYQVNGAALAAADSQLWLMGVDEWRLVAAPAVLLSFAEAA